MFSIIKIRRIWYVVSSLLVIASLVSFGIFGLKPGIDFTGGTLLEISFEERPSQQIILDFLSQQNVANATVQLVDDKGIILRFAEITEEKHQELLSALKQKYSFEELRFDSVGPAIGNELKQKTIWALVIVSIAIIAYIAFAFRKVSKPVASWKYGLIALLALLHDITITIGVFVALGQIYNLEVNAPFVAALLTILGYSVNDTIVVFDRIRENLIKKAGEQFEKVTQLSLNETLIRSINSSTTTLIVLFAVLLLGGTTIRDFVLALIIGISIGTYSSIFIAAPLLVTWEKFTRR